MVRYDEVDKMLTVSDVAKILHVHPNTLRRWSEQETIGAYRMGVSRRPQVQAKRHR